MCRKGGEGTATLLQRQTPGLIDNKMPPCGRPFKSQCIQRKVYWNAEDGKTYVYDAIMQRYSLSESRLFIFRLIDLRA